MITQSDIDLEGYLHSLKSLTHVRPTDIMKWLKTPELQFELLTKSKNPVFIQNLINQLALTLFFIRSILLSWAYQPDTDPLEEPFLGYSVLEELQVPTARELKTIAETLQEDPFEWIWRTYQLLKDLYRSLWFRITTPINNQNHSNKQIMDSLLASHHGNLAFLAVNVYHFFQLYLKNEESAEKSILHDILVFLKEYPEYTNQVRTFIMTEIEQLEMANSSTNQNCGIQTEFFTSPRHHLLPNMKWKNKTVVVGIRFNSLEVFLDVAVTEPLVENEITIHGKHASLSPSDNFSMNGKETVLDLDQISWDELERFMTHQGYMTFSKVDCRDVKLVEHLIRWLAARCMILLDSWITNQPQQIILVMERSISTDFSPFQSPTCLNLKFLAHVGHRVLGLVEELASRWNPLVKVHHVDVEPRWDICPLCYRPIDEAHLIQLQPDESVSFLATLTIDDRETIQVHVMRQLTSEPNQANDENRSQITNDEEKPSKYYLVGDLSGIMPLQLKRTTSPNILHVGKSYRIRGAKIEHTKSQDKILVVDDEAEIFRLPYSLPHVNTDVDLSNERM